MSPRWTMLPAALLAASPVFGNGLPTLRLSLSAPPELAGPCESSAALEARISERLGRNPFTPSPEKRVSVELDKEMLDGRIGEFRARLTVVDERTREVLGERELKSADCRELFDAIALSVGLIFDPLGRATPEPRPTLEPPPRGPPIALLPQPQGDKLEPSAISASTSVGPWLSIGTSPAPSVSLRAAIWVSSERLRFGLEGSYDFATSAVVDRRSGVAVELISARLLGCFRPAPWQGCAVVAGGVHRATGEALEGSMGATTPYSSVGLRLGIDLGLTSRVTLRPELEALLTLTRTTFRVSGEPAWVSPVGSLGLGVDFDFDLFDSRRIEASRSNRDQR